MDDAHHIAGDSIADLASDMDTDGAVPGEFIDRAKDLAAGSLDAALAEAEAALPYKRWTVYLSGDWEDGWVASAMSRPAGEGGIEVTTEGVGWGADRGGLRTPAAALRALAERLREVER